MESSDSLPSTLAPYYESLDILEKSGVKITLNAVAIGAGKSPGSIKKSRPIFHALIREIQARAKKQQETSAPGTMKAKAAKLENQKNKTKAETYKEKYKAALARELMLLIAWDKAVKELRGNKVVPIKTPKRPL